MGQNVTTAANAGLSAYDDLNQRNTALLWESQELRCGQDGSKAEARVEVLGTVLVVGTDPEMLDVSGRRDRGLGQSRATALAAVLGQDVEPTDLDLVVAKIKPGEGDWTRAVIDGQDADAESEADLARLGVEG